MLSQEVQRSGHTPEKQSSARFYFSWM